jgi:hypothetical protein
MSTIASDSIARFIRFIRPIGVYMVKRKKRERKLKRTVSYLAIVDGVHVPVGVDDDQQ